MHLHGINILVIALVEARTTHRYPLPLIGFTVLDEIPLILL